MNCRMAFSRSIGFILLAVVLLSGSAQAALINGNFETGYLNPWTAYTTSNGTLGAVHPSVASFDVAGTGTSSSALAVSVGYAVAPCAYPGYECPSPLEGGGIRQTVMYSGGWTTLHADVAVDNSTLYGGYNLTGGTFSLFVDGTLLDSFSVGEIAAGTVQRGDLDVYTFLSPGSHIIDILITRPAAECRSLTQYIDNISLSPVPEPTTALLLGLGLVGIAAAGRKFRQRQ
jgi:hypothetical protein